MQSPVHMEQQLHSMRKPVGARQVGQFALYSLPPFSVNFRSRSSKVQPLFLTIFKRFSSCFGKMNRCVNAR